MSLKLTLGELTGKEFHWGLVAGLAGSAIGDIFSSNAAQNAQQQAEQNAQQLQQQAISQQEAYIAQQEQAQRQAIASAASNGNPMLQAAGHVAKPTALALPSAPNMGGGVFSNGSGTPGQAQQPQVQQSAQFTPQQLSMLYRNSPQQNVLGPQSAPNQNVLAPPQMGQRRMVQ